MSKTSRTMVQASPTAQPSRAPARRQPSKAATEQISIGVIVLQIVKDLRIRVSAMTPSVEQRAVVSELRRYERALDNWPTVSPSESQRAALLDQLLLLDDRIRRSAEAGASMPPTTPRTSSGMAPSGTSASGAASGTSASRMVTSKMAPAAVTRKLRRATDA